MQVRSGKLLGRREEGLILEVPGIYVYVVSAKITRLPSKLSASHSYYQHGHDDTSETRGVVDEERSSHFPMRRVHRGHLSNTCKPRIYMYVVSAKITRLPSKLSPTHSYYQHGHDDTSETRGVFDEERSSYFPHAPRAPRAPFQHVQAPHLSERCEC